MMVAMLRLRLLEIFLSFYNAQSEHDTDMKVTLIDFSCRVTEGSRSSWLQTLGNQLIDRSPYIRYTNRKYYLLYNIT